MKHGYIIIPPKHFSLNEEAIIFVKQLFCREKRRVLFGRVTEMRASLGEVCSYKETMLKKILKKCLVGNFSEYPRNIIVCTMCHHRFVVSLDFIPNQGTRYDTTCCCFTAFISDARNCVGRNRDLTTSRATTRM